NVVIDIAAEYTGNKAFNQAQTATAKLEKSVAKLGKQFLGVFAASKILAYGKASVKAFAADEKAARSLSLALANTGNAFAGIQVENFIADLQRTTGVLDDELRPAFRTLLTATGDVKKSQDGLALALDIAAGTGKDLGAVSMALAKAYGGQTTALGRLGAGLSKATLKTGDMNVITQTLTDKFKGQALAAAEGYSGSIDRLSVASQNAKEIIGKDLLDSLALLSGPDGISKSTKQMEDLATAIGNTVYGLAILIDKIKANKIGGGILGTFGDIIANLQPFASLRKLGASSKATSAQSPGERKQIDKINADALKFQKQQNDLKKIDNANTARKITLTGDELALQELSKKFDVERIGLYAALNQSTDGETQMRLLSLIAIKDQNAALAGMIQKATQTTDALTTFRQAIIDAIKALISMVNMEIAKLNTQFPTALTSGGGGVSSNPYDPNAVTGGMPGAVLSNQFSAGTFRAAEAATTNITVNVQGSVTTQQDLVSAITQGIYNNQASGIPISYTTAFR
ncbi:MAG: hypothetical protein EBR82_60570, partial [Caulobacteraceae bacterium]|nr:hypothetical protein [Caulobacteraceae bacterium]